ASWSISDEKVAGKPGDGYACYFGIVGWQNPLRRPGAALSSAPPLPSTQQAMILAEPLDRWRRETRRPPVFQFNVSNGVGTTIRQVARGGSKHDTFLGFNITRTFWR